MRPRLGTYTLSFLVHSLDIKASPKPAEISTRETESGFRRERLQIIYEYFFSNLPYRDYSRSCELAKNKSDKNLYPYRAYGLVGETDNKKTSKRNNWHVT